MRVAGGLLAGIALAGLVAGCGGSTAPSGPRTVSVSVLAPNPGAIVAVRQIDVVGAVSPAGARVVVGRARTRVVRGGFRRALTLRPGVNHIRVVATARGYRRAVGTVSVRYRPRGGGSSDPFFARAQAACSALTAGIRSLPRVTSDAVVMSDLRGELPIVSTFIARMQALRGLSQGLAGFYSFLGELRHERTLIAEFVARPAPGDSQQITSVDQRVAGRAAALGFSDCETEPIPSG